MAPWLRRGRDCLRGPQWLAAAVRTPCSNQSRSSDRRLKRFRHRRSPRNRCRRHRPEGVVDRVQAQMPAWKPLSCAESTPPWMAGPSFGLGGPAPEIIGGGADIGAEAVRRNGHRRGCEHECGHENWRCLTGCAQGLRDHFDRGLSRWAARVRDRGAGQGCTTALMSYWRGVKQGACHERNVTNSLRSCGAVAIKAQSGGTDAGQYRVAGGPSRAALGARLWGWVREGGPRWPLLLNYYEIRAAPSLPRPLGKGWGEGRIMGRGDLSSFGVARVAPCSLAEMCRTALTARGSSSTYQRRCFGTKKTVHRPATGAPAAAVET